MAETVPASGAKATDSDIDGIPYSPEKRKASEVGDGEPQEKKKFSMSLAAKKPQSSGVEKKISISLGGVKKQPQAPTGPIKMSLSTQKTKEPAPVKPRTAKVAQIFNEDESDEEEMPPEAKMRMRNIGRDTPTAAGPNSFGKGKLGFCDRQRILERQLKQQMDDVSGDH